MKKNFFTVTRICNLLCAILMLVMLVMQFLPYWNNNGQDFSLADYVWYPQEKAAKALTKVFDKTCKSYGLEYDINDLVTAPVVTFAVSILTAILCIKFSNKAALAILPLFAAIMNINGFTSVLVLKLNSMWRVFVILSAIILALCLVILVKGIIDTIKKDRAILAERAAKAE